MSYRVDDDHMNMVKQGRASKKEWNNQNKRTVVKIEQLIVRTLYGSRPYSINYILGYNRTDT